MAARPRKLSERELELMQVLWEVKNASVGEVHERLGPGGDLAYTTVQTMLNRLEAKGFVKRELSGRAYRYSAKVQEPAEARRAVRALIDRFFGGSSADLAVHLVERELNANEIRRVEALLEESRKGGSR